MPTLRIGTLDHTEGERIPSEVHILLRLQESIVQHFFCTAKVFDVSEVQLPALAALHLLSFGANILNCGSVVGSSGFIVGCDLLAHGDSFDKLPAGCSAIGVFDSK